MKKLLALVLCLILMLIPATAFAMENANSADGEEQISVADTALAAFAVLFTADNNGTMKGDDAHIGYSRIAGFMAQQPEDATMLLLDAGNALGTEDPDKVVKVMGAAGYTAANIGLKDAALGKSTLIEMAAKANFPLLCANWLKKNGDLYFAPYKVVEIGELKVGIIGLISPSILETLPEETDGDNVYDPAPIADIYHDELVEYGCTCFIALTSLGTEGDYNVSYLGTSCPWIDVILDSETDDFMEGGNLVTDTDVAVFNLQPDFSSMYILELSAGVYGYQSIYPSFLSVSDFANVTREQRVEDIINTDYNAIANGTYTEEGTVTRSGGLPSVLVFGLLAVAICVLTGAVIGFVMKKKK